MRYQRRITEAVLNYDERHDVRERAKAAFADLRRGGFLARAAFSCCGVCAGYELGQKAAALAEKGRTVAGVVYWHKQSDEHLRDDGAPLWFGWGSLDGDDARTGWQIVRAMEQHGLAVEWSGSAANCIMVTLPEHLARTTATADAHGD